MEALLHKLKEFNASEQWKNCALFTSLYEYEDSLRCPSQNLWEWPSTSEQHKNKQAGFQKPNIL